MNKIIKTEGVSRRGCSITVRCKDSAESRVMFDWIVYNTKMFRDTWANLWNNVVKIQKKIGFETSVPIDIINKNQLIINEKYMHSYKKVFAARKLLKSLSKRDKVGYGRIVKIVNIFYRFDRNSIPHQRMDMLSFDRALDKAIVEADRDKLNK